MVSCSSQCFHIRNYIEKIFGYSITSKRSWLEAGGFIYDSIYKQSFGTQDTAFKTLYERFVDQVKTRTADKAGVVTPGTKFVWRKSGSLFVDFMPSDFSNCQTGIINGIAIRIEVKIPSAKEFLLCKDVTLNPVFKISEFELLVPCAELTESLSLKLMNRLKKEDALIHFHRRTVIPLTIKAGTPIFFAESKIFKSVIKKKQFI